MSSRNTSGHLTSSGLLFLRLVCVHADFVREPAYRPEFVFSTVSGFSVSGLPLTWANQGRLHPHECARQDL